MKKHQRRPLSDNYRSGLLVALIIFISQFANAQVPQQYNQYGSQWKRVQIDNLLTLPGDTFAVPTYYRGRGNLSIKGDSLYIWSVFLQKYILYRGSGTLDTTIYHSYNYYKTKFYDITNPAGYVSTRDRFGWAGEDDSLKANRQVIGNNGSVSYDLVLKNVKNFRVIAGGPGTGTRTAELAANDSVHLQSDVVNLDANKLVGRGLSMADGSGSLVYVKWDTISHRFEYDPTVDSTSITTVGTITVGTWWATPIDLAHGGTGSRLVDPGGDKIMYYDNTADSVRWLSLSSDFTIASNTLQAVPFYYRNPQYKDSIFFVRAGEPDALYAKGVHVAAGSSKVTATETYQGDSLIIHTVDVVEANLTLNNLGGILNAAHGGTGVNNGANTITIGGNVTYSGAFTFAGTVTANTAVTFPVSGTLYGTASGSFASAALATSLSDETGTGVAVFGTSPTISNLQLSNMPTISTATTNYFYVGGSSGLLAQTGQVQINAGGEVLIGGITDQGAYALQVGTGATYIGGNLTYAQQLSSTKQTLTDGATITWNWNSGTNAEVTLGGNRTLSITNAIAGTYGTIRVVQDGTGSRTLALPASSKVISGGSGAITLSTAASSVDVLTVYYDGTSYFWSYGKNYN